MRGLKNTYVGGFFEYVGHSAIGGVLSRNDDGDICIWEKGLTVEVKASGFQSQYGFRNDMNQIKRYQARTGGFPFAHGCYMFFAYDNPSPRINGKRSSKLSKYTELRAVNRYLARSVLWCVLVDLSIVTRWSEQRDVSDKSLLGHLGTETIDVKCREVAHLANGGLRIELEKLGLDPEKYETLAGNLQLKVRTGLPSRHKMRVPITTILPIAQSKLVRRIFKERGHDLRPAQG